MGICGLHTELKPYCRRVHLERYRGQRLAADGYSWLHKGVYSCASLVAQGKAPWLARGRPAPYVEYCLKRMRMLRHFGITPTLVFDGDRLPAKSEEEAERRARRAARKADGLAALARGDRAAAEAAFQSCIDVTPQMAREVMDGLAAEGFAFLVAPFEADAQLAHLARTGAADVIATEDSDLAAYGVPVILFKLDAYGGAQELRMADVLSGAPPKPEPGEGDAEEDAGEANGGGGESVPDADEEAVLATAKGSRKGSRGGGVPLSFRRFDRDLFLCMCVLAGCDFLRSLPGVGIRRAHALARRAGSAPRLVALLRTDPKLNAPPAYLQGFLRALRTFRHARVYDVAARALVPLEPLCAELAAEGVSTAFLGPDYPAHEAQGVAEGRLDPFTRRPFAPRPGPGGVRSPHGRAAPTASPPPLAPWPFAAGAPRRRSTEHAALHVSPSPWRARQHAEASAAAPPAEMNTSISGLGRLLGGALPAHAPPSPVVVYDDADDAPPSPPPQPCEAPAGAAGTAAAAAPAANPFARKAGAAMPHRVSALFACAVSEKENGALEVPPPPPPVVPVPPRGALGRMWAGALNAGAAWIAEGEPEPPRGSAAGGRGATPVTPAVRSRTTKAAAPAAHGIARFFAPAGGAKRAGAPAAAASPPKRARPPF